MSKRIIFKVFGIPLIMIAVFVVTLLFFVGKVDERKFAADAYTTIVDVLPENADVSWTEELPQNEIKQEYKWIQIDLSEQKMYLYEDKKIIDEFLVSSGKSGMETPIGEFMVYGKKDRAWSKMAGLWMPLWMMIEPRKGIGIHELPEWPNGYKEGADHLGTAVSHGCIRLGVGPAEIVYNWAEIGTRVEIVE